MTDSRKKRMSLLDNLTAAGTPAATGSMMSSNRALRSARDAVDAHHVWELDPEDIEDSRMADRLDPEDVADLRRSIEQNGQTVPILVRRHPRAKDRYLLVYGRRRLEAIRGSDKLDKVRALIASLNDDSALRAQVSENTGRRDLSYIERALFAGQLLDNKFGSQVEIAEVLNVTRSTVSMAVSVAKIIGPDLARAIGPAHGIGRPRWEALTRDLAKRQDDIPHLCEVARKARDKAEARVQTGGDAETQPDPSVAAFDAVCRALAKTAGPKPGAASRQKATVLKIGGDPAGTVRKTAKGVRLDLTNVDNGFADWLEQQAQTLIHDLHEQWQRET